MPPFARRTVQPAARDIHLPAPIGGLNTISAGTAMPPSDCFALYNMIPAEYGLRTRLGSRQWCTSLSGAADEYVRSILPFTGSASNGTNNKLFASTSDAIYDVTASSGSPSSVLAFGSSAGRAGHGTCHTHVTVAGHFLLYFDEVNGLHVYTESSDTFAAVAMGSGGTEIDGVDPANLVHGTVFKGRIWAVEKDTANLWYSDAGAIYGTWTKFALGTKLKAGGSLRGVYNWTYDGGAGLDDSLVAISDGGDVVVYQGTDPASASTFGISGVWQVGDLPAGREIASDLGGELLILTRLGILPMSRLVLGKSIQPGQYETAKISNLFNAAMLTKATVPGWSMRLHPEDNALIVTVPEAEGASTTQLVMSLTNRAWSRYRDLPIYCTGVFGGKMYFGDVNGNVWINDGNVDGVLRSDPNTYTAIQYAGLSAFQNLGSPRMKQIQLIRPTFIGQSASPDFTVDARYDFNSTELAAVSFAGGAADGWDSGEWDEAVWGGEYSPTLEVRGATGVGINAAVIWRGASVDRTVLVGFDIVYTQGGFL